MAEKKQMKVILIRYTPLPQESVALAAKLCYSRSSITDLEARVSAADQSDFIARLKSMGHDSIFEHASFTFGIEGVSRVLLAQLTRHRLASFSVQSQRYVSYEKGFGYIIPPRIEALGDEAVQEYAAQMEQIEQWYTEWQKKLGSKGESSNEDARFVLPNACETRILMTMNVRELWHFFALRMCSRAQWEIRAMAEQMHALCMQAAPELFCDSGPACLRGKCPEGEKSCGLAEQKRRERREMIDRMTEDRKNAVL